MTSFDGETLSVTFLPVGWFTTVEQRVHSPCPCLQVVVLLPGCSLFR